VAGFIGVVLGLCGAILFLVAGFPLATRGIAAHSAYGFRSADTDGDDEIWYMANAAIGRELVLTAGVDLILLIVAIVYWGDETAQSALGIAVVLISIGGAIYAVAKGLMTARALGKAKQAFPSHIRRW
jgi:hypothetical protein